MVWEKLGTVTGAMPQEIEVTTKKFMVNMMHAIGNNDGNIDQLYRFNDEGGGSTDFAYRTSLDGAVDETPVVSSTDFISTQGLTSRDYFTIVYLTDISSEEVLVISNSVTSNAYGAATAPSRTQTAGKYVDGPITKYEFEEGGAGTSTSDSNSSVLGTD